MISRESVRWGCLRWACAGWLVGVGAGNVPLQAAPAVAKAAADAVTTDTDQEFFPEDQANQPQELARPEIGPEQFEQWVFGGVMHQRGNGVDSGADLQVKRLTEILEARCENVQAVAQLTDQQMLKLRLAGQGDIHRFLQKVAVARAKFEKLRQNPEAFNAIWQDIHPLQERINAGLFDSDSLFQKVLTAMLDTRQSATLSADEQERRTFAYQARIRQAVVQWERLLPLTETQRDALIDRLEKSPAPLKFGQHDYSYVLFQLSQLPNRELRPLFDPKQWAHLERLKRQGKHQEEMLRQQGVLPPEPSR